MNNYSKKFPFSLVFALKIIEQFPLAETLFSPIGWAFIRNSTPNQKPPRSPCVHVSALSRQVNRERENSRVAPIPPKRHWGTQETHIFANSSARSLSVLGKQRARHTNVHTYIRSRTWHSSECTIFHHFAHIHIPSSRKMCVNARVLLRVRYGKAPRVLTLECRKRFSRCENIQLVQLVTLHCVVFLKW